eukprot:SAG31_NODE_1262_length_9072_cov_11.697760_2_plen_180_part_00
MAAQNDWVAGGIDRHVEVQRIADCRSGRQQVILVASLIVDDRNHASCEYRAPAWPGVRWTVGRVCHGAVLLLTAAAELIVRDDVSKSLECVDIHRGVARCPLELIHLSGVAREHGSCHRVCSSGNCQRVFAAAKMTAVVYSGTQSTVIAAGTYGRQRKGCQCAGRYHKVSVRLSHRRRS